LMMLMILILMLLLCRCLRLDMDRSYRKDSLGKKALGILKLYNMF
jgi:hypothetical protein